MVRHIKSMLAVAIVAVLGGSVIRATAEKPGKDVAPDGLYFGYGVDGCKPACGLQLTFSNGKLTEGTVVVLHPEFPSVVEGASYPLKSIKKLDSGVYRFEFEYGADKMVVVDYFKLLPPTDADVVKFQFSSSPEFTNPRPVILARVW